MIEERLSFRRPLTAGLAAISLLAGLFAVRVAADWTASASPLNEAPPSIQSLKAALTAERDRSEALQSQLGQLTIRSAGLSEALHAANERVRADMVHARSLERKLASASVRLARLEASLRKQRASRPVQTIVTSGASSGSVVSSSDDDGETDDG
jgi:septal ring factor EnvC (AmiA/AmiB activator)